MSFEFYFAKAKEYDASSLQQGDILTRTPQLQAALGAAHQFYATAADYTHFMVLTQSCDLAFHGGKKFNSRYITLAAARPIATFIEMLTRGHTISDIPNFPIKLLQASIQTNVTNTLERLVHNTADGYFFIKGGSHPMIEGDLCVYLALSVALKAEHYEACLSSKCAQLESVFQAKVGWLTGNLYSRVGTPDVEEEHPETAAAIKQEFYDQALGYAVWLTSAQKGRLTSKVREWKKANQGVDLNVDAAKQLLETLPSPLHIAAERVVDLLQEKKSYCPKGQKPRAKRCESS